MEAKTNLKSRLPSQHVTEGPARAPHCSYSYAMGLTDEQIHQPVGVANCGNEAGLENAAAAGAASRRSTNVVPHLPAIAPERGIAFDLFDVAEVFKRTPYIADLKLGSRFVAKDLFEGGSIPLPMKTLLDNGFLHGECSTVTGCNMVESLHRVAWNPDRDVVRPADRPLTATDGVVGLHGNPAPDGAIVKMAGLENLKFTGRARCFGGPEAAIGGPIGLLRDGGIISIDAMCGSPDVQLSGAELEQRRAAWQPRGTAFGSGYIWKYAQQVGPARHGAVTHLEGSAEKACHADI